MHESHLLISGLSVSYQAFEGEPLLGPVSMTAMARGRAAGDGPDLASLADLVKYCRRPVIAEGRYTTPVHDAEAIAQGES